MYYGIVVSLKLELFWNVKRVENITIFEISREKNKKLILFMPSHIIVKTMLTLLILTCF